MPKEGRWRSSTLKILGWCSDTETPHLATPRWMQPYNGHCHESKMFACHAHESRTWKKKLKEIVSTVV